MTDDVTKTDVKRGTDCIGVTLSFVCHDGRGNVLLHKRSARCRDEQGKWCVGGGALEFGETFEACLAREIQEEYSAVATDMRFLGTLNVLRENEGVQTHWVSIGYAVKINPDEVKVGEPEKVDEIGWFTPSSLPSPTHTTMPTWVKMAKDAGIL